MKTKSYLLPRPNNLSLLRRSIAQSFVFMFQKIIHPRKLTWNLKMPPWKRKNIFQTSIFGLRLHVNFRGCTSLDAPPPKKKPAIFESWGSGGDFFHMKFQRVKKSI